MVVKSPFRRRLIYTLIWFVKLFRCLRSVHESQRLLTVDLKLVVMLFLVPARLLTSFSLEKLLKFLRRLLTRYPTMSSVRVVTVRLPVFGFRGIGQFHFLYFHNPDYIGADSRGL